MLCDGFHAGVEQCACGNRHRHRTHDVGTARLLAIGQTRPLHVGRRHDIHGSATLVLRIALQEEVARANQRPGAKRRVHLVRRQRHEIEMLGVVVRPDVDAAVGCQLRRVDQDACPDGMCLSRQTMDGLDKPGDVRGAADRQQGDAVTEGREQPINVVFVKASVLGHLRSHHVSTTAPRQVVGVVLHFGREHHVPFLERVAVGQLVDGFSRVLPQNDDVGVDVGSNEARDRVVRLVIGRRADAGLEAGATVDAGVVGQKLVDGLEDRLQWRCAGSVVQVHVSDELAVKERHFLLQASDSHRPTSRALKGRPAHGRGLGSRRCVAVRVEFCMLDGDRVSRT